MYNIQVHHRTKVYFLLSYIVWKIFALNFPNLSHISSVKRYLQTTLNANFCSYESEQFRLNFKMNTNICVRVLSDIKLWLFWIFLNKSSDHSSKRQNLKRLILIKDSKKFMRYACINAYKLYLQSCLFISKPWLYTCWEHLNVGFTQHTRIQARYALLC